MEDSEVRPVDRQREEPERDIQLIVHVAGRSGWQQAL